ncbi:hypothetical protein EXIGLDRAFT_759249 [Exidia glandulosa HHB12029]|uniref:Peptidase S33 tripeptidyl aminopeptidase-like C-terminal domain-containing protein n=1 Tax=Exidia glandulosa HHB12029 TaxID=1314781 RepID=A0A165QC14_EXIGL|nr:hypothetical protein EXIGLDRAFT_759249 [Exidia glandulosa HHB12029]
MGREPERFTGPWNHTLANQMLIASALYDPITPLPSARLINQLMPHSTRLIISDTPGHGTQAATGAMSLCIAHAFSAYFLNGTLPENEQHCPPDRKIFEPPKEKEIRLQSLSTEDALLAEALDRFALGWNARMFMPQY